MHAATHRGLVREVNEDTFGVGDVMSSHPASRVLSLRLDLDDPVVCVVADGLGGHVGGDRASQLAVRTILEHGRELSDGAAVASAVEAAQDALYEEMARRPDLEGMGTTIAGLVFSDGKALGFNVGDSRHYEIVDGMLVQLSVDDSPPPPPGGLAGAATVTVTKSLGGAASPSPLDVHLHEHALAEGAAYLICSDGLTDYVPLERIESVAGAGPPRRAMARRLVEIALEAGGRDNVTVVLVGKLPEGGPHA